jgi:hypothetical protein
MNKDYILLRILRYDITKNDYLKNIFFIIKKIFYNLII